MHDSGGFLKILVCLTVVFMLGAAPALADEAGQCSADGGHLVTGTLLQPPGFVRGHDKDGIELSHTSLELRADDGTIYDVRADNVYAAGYDQAGRSVPAPLSALQPGERLELCGNIYTKGDGSMGMDWVHSNCGRRPRPGKPDGWLKLIGADALPGPNLEASQEYCSLWH